MTVLSDEDNEKIHKQFMPLALYRALQTPLTVLQVRCGGLSPTDTWYQAILVLKTLKDSRPYESTEVVRIYPRLLKDARMLTFPDGHTEKKDDAFVRLTVVTILLVVCEILENTAEVSAHPYMLCDSDATVYNIFYVLKDEPLLRPLMEFLLDSSHFMNRAVVFPDMDPWELVPDDVAPPTQKEKTGVVIDDFKEKTQLLKPLLGGYWRLWIGLWDELLKMPSMADRLTDPTPKTKPMGDLNAKMICNVLGIFRSVVGLKVTTGKLSGALCAKHSLNNYIDKHGCDADGNSTSLCVFNRQEIKMIEKSVRDLQSADNQCNRKQTENNRN